MGHNCSAIGVDVGLPAHIANIQARVNIVCKSSNFGVFSDAGFQNVIDTLIVINCATCISSGCQCPINIIVVAVDIVNAVIIGIANWRASNSIVVAAVVVNAVRIGIANWRANNNIVVAAVVVDAARTIRVTYWRANNNIVVAAAGVVDAVVAIRVAGCARDGVVAAAGVVDAVTIAEKI